MEAQENIIELARRRPTATPDTPHEITAQGQIFRLRRATVSDAAAIQSLYQEAYEGRYGLAHACNSQILQAELLDSDSNLWVVAEARTQTRVVGTIVFRTDRKNRLGKAAGAVVATQFRNLGLGTELLRLGVNHLTRHCGVDAIYATTRTINEAPSRVVAEVGFHPMGIFPNAILVENFEHLNLDIYFTPAALEARRKRPFLIPAFEDVYQIGRKCLGLERASTVTELAPLSLGAQRIPLEIVRDEPKAMERFLSAAKQKRLRSHFLPFCQPNQILRTSDGGTEIFVHFGGVAMQSAIVGFRTDRVNTHDLLDAAAHTLERAGAAYVEFLVDAYNPRLQQSAFAARFIPSAYFPAMKLAEDGLRDDYFVLTRTFRLLDFSGSVLCAESRKYLKAYLRHYNALYIKPILA